MYLISYSIYICTVAIIHLEIYHNFKKKKNIWLFLLFLLIIFSA